MYLENKNGYCLKFCEKIFAAAAHCGQSRALFLRRRGRIQSYTPSAYSSQNTTLSRTASTDSR